MTTYYQEPLNQDELIEYDNQPEVLYAKTFNPKSLGHPMFDSTFSILTQRPYSTKQSR